MVKLSGEWQMRVFGEGEGQFCIVGISVTSRTVVQVGMFSSSQQWVCQLSSIVLIQSLFLCNSVIAETSLFPTVVSVCMIASPHGHMPLSTELHSTYLHTAPHEWTLLYNRSTAAGWSVIGAFKPFFKRSASKTFVMFTFPVVLTPESLLLYQIS